MVGCDMQYGHKVLPSFEGYSSHPAAQITWYLLSLSVILILSDSDFTAVQDTDMPTEADLD